MRTGRRGRQAAIALSAAAVAVAAVVATRNDSEPAGRFEPLHSALCRVLASTEQGDLEAARTQFVDVAHASLHELAARLEQHQRSVAAQLLEAKGRVESGFSAATTIDMATAVATLADRTRTAIAATGDRRPPPCTENQ